MFSENHITLKDLYVGDFELTDVFAMRQRWKAGAVFSMAKPRTKSAVICLNACSGRYFDADGKGFDAPRGSVVILPATST